MHQKTTATQTRRLRLNQSEHQLRCNGRISSSAALLQNLEGSLCGQGVRRSDSNFCIVLSQVKVGILCGKADAGKRQSNADACLHKKAVPRWM